MRTGIFRWLALFVVGSGWVFGASPDGTVPRVVLGESAVVLQRWLALGPFVANPGEEALTVDFVRKFGHAESAWTQDSAAKLAAVSLGSSTITAMGRLVDGSDTVDFDRLYGALAVGVQKNAQTAVYAVCEIFCLEPREAWLLLASDDGAKVWINDVEEYVSRDRRRIKDGADAVRLNLRKGTNLLVLKVTNLDGDWMVNARVEPSKLAAVRTSLAGAREFLRHQLIPHGGRLEFKRGIPDSFEAEARLDDRNGRPVRSVRIGGREPTDLTGLPQDLYRLHWKWENKNYEQEIFWGGLSEMRRELASVSAPLLKTEREGPTLSALLKWLEVFQESPRFDPPDASPLVRRPRAVLRDWEYKAVFIASKIYETVERSKRAEETFRDRTGLHVRGFRSVIDDQIMSYRLFVPSSYRRSKGLPLVMIMPAVFAYSAPYLESLFIGEHREAEPWAAVAEKLGVGILWPGYRVRPYGNPTDEHYLDEVLSTVAKDYALDSARLYLFGHCSSGITSAMTVVANPQRYAAVALLNPVLHRTRNRYDDDDSFREWRAYNEWLREADPLQTFAGVADLPVWIIHDGVDPDHGPLGDSVEFVDLARAMGRQPKFERRKYEGREPARIEVFEEQLGWLAQQSRKTPATLDFGLTSGAGPISRAFAERFIVVVPSGGNDTDQTANRNLITAFQAAWKKTNYVSCRAILDGELTIEEERASNLILLGSESSNATWARLAARLPIKIAKESIEIGGKIWSGDALAVQAWFPHPDQLGKKVVLIGAARPEHAVFGTLELALDGWFDFSVWRQEADRPVLVAAERFPAR